MADPRIPKASPLPTPTRLARVQVLSTPELLINILYFLPIKDLLHAQRLNRYYLKIIKDSLLLQQCLFLKPFPLKLSKEGCIIQGTELNTLLQEKFPWWFTKWTWVEHRDDDMIIGVDGELPELQRKFEAAPSFIDSNASWRRMLMAQPPIRQLGIMSCETVYTLERNWFFWGTTTRPSWGVLDLSNTASCGLTISYLYNQVFKEITDDKHDFKIF